MPRAKKTASGVPGQKVQAITGQEYGKGKQQEALQRTMPAPNQVAVTPPAPTRVQPNPEPTPQAAAPQSRPQMDFGQLTEQLRGAGGILRQPDDRPDVPFNATLNDPSAAARLGLASPKSRTGQIMRDLSDRTGDPVFADLAARAGL